MNRCVIAAACCLWFPTWGWAENWPAWRGPQGAGHSAEAEAPLEWSQDKNVVWKVPLPGPGNSTPIVWQDRVYLTGAEREGAVRSLMCFDRRDGKLRWKKDVNYESEKPELTHNTNPYCASSPVTDGRRIVVWHGSAGLFAYDLEGQQIWRKDLGKFEHIWGYASSPLLFDNLAIVSCGPGLRAFVAAFDIDSGREVWRFAPPQAQSEKVDEFRGSWSTPVLHQEADRTVLLLSLPLKLHALNPRSGKEIWSCDGLGKLVYTSPLPSAEIVVAMSGYHGPSLAVRGGGEGDVTPTRRLWLHEEKKQNPQRVGSGVIVGDHIFILNEIGVAWCLDLKSGEKKWEQRLGRSKSWSSMCHVAGRLYIINMEGATYVLEPNPTECKILAENPLGELTRGSLAFSAGQIFVRTYEHLYCIGQQQ